MQPWVTVGGLVVPQLRFRALERYSACLVSPPTAAPFVPGIPSSSPVLFGCRHAIVLSGTPADGVYIRDTTKHMNGRETYWASDAMLAYCAATDEWVAILNCITGGIRCSTLEGVDGSPNQGCRGSYCCPQGLCKECPTDLPYTEGRPSSAPTVPSAGPTAAPSFRLTAAPSLSPTVHSSCI
eukprot:gene57760-biopygen119988